MTIPLVFCGQSDDHGCVPPRPNLLRAFVDETGDRGMRATSSTYFAFGAVVYRDTNAELVLSELNSLGTQLGRAPSSVIHWSRNMKDHADRKLAASRLGGLPVRLIYVVVPKTSIRATSHLARSTEGYYNFAARLLLERVGLFTSRVVCPTGTPFCKVTFGRVKGFNPAKLREYITLVRSTSGDRCWQYLSPTIDVLGQSECRPLQWADIAAGALDSAIKPDKHGQYEPAYWLAMRPLVDAPNGRLLRNGLKVLGDEGCITRLPWWPSDN